MRCLSDSCLRPVNVSEVSAAMNATDTVEGVCVNICASDLQTVALDCDTFRCATSSDDRRAQRFLGPPPRTTDETVAFEFQSDAEIAPSSSRHSLAASGEAQFPIAVLIALWVSGFELRKSLVQPAFLVSFALPVSAQRDVSDSRRSEWDLYLRLDTVLDDFCSVFEIRCTMVAGIWKALPTLVKIQLLL